MTSSNLMTGGRLEEKFGYAPVDQHEAGERVYNPTTVASAVGKQSRAARLTAECCYSISNLALIIGCAVALVLLVKFNSSLDRPLYEYGDILLTRRFYYQLIYILVVVALVLLVPLYNAAGALLFPSDAKRAQAARTLLILKIFFQAALVGLVFVALVFVSPYIRASNLANQIELELAKHIGLRYDQPLSYEMLNSLQEEYECCDELWYRSKLANRLPLSCFKPNTNFEKVYGVTCARAIGLDVSSRCAILAAALVALLVGLVCLLVDDIKESRALPRQRYEVGRSRPQRSANSGAPPGQLPRNGSDDDDTARVGNNNNETPRHGGAQLKRPDAGDSLASINRLLSGERDESPQRNLQSTAKQAAPRARADTCDDELDEEQFREQLIHVQQSKSPTILARANYHVVERDRSQSPVFLSRAREEEPASLDAAGQAHKLKPATATVTTSGGSSPPGSAIRSALKRGPSAQRLEPGAAESPAELAPPSSSPEEADSLDEYAERLRTSSLHRLTTHHEQHTKRSLLNVRFADS